MYILYTYYTLIYTVDSHYLPTRARKIKRRRYRIDGQRRAKNPVSPPHRIYSATFNIKICVKWNRPPGRLDDACKELEV